MLGERLGPYLIERELGAGGMGTVYAATVEREVAGIAPATTVALKLVHPHLLGTEGFFKRFLREAQIGRSVLHENVVRTLDCDALDDHHFLVMEYVEGQDLRDLLAELDKVPEELCRHIGREVAKGLAAIHAAGVVHRDLKPENVLITPDHVVKVMDLGVAQLTEQTIRLSQTGAFVGSVEYAAPEQFGGDVDHRCDLHALGVLLYELSTGQHPYRADDFRAVMHHVMDEDPRRLGEVNPQLSAFFEEVVHTLLAKRADDRFVDAADLLTVLEEGEDSDWWKERAETLRATTNRPIRRIRIPRETAVYGREQELGRLRGLFDKAKSGDGQVVLVEGEAGIGKSRLVDEFVARLRADGEDLNFLFGSYPPSGAAMAEGGFSTAFREQFGDAGSAPYLPDTPLLVPAFDALLTGHPPPKDALELTKDSIGTCFVHATRHLATERTTVVLIDDLHFAPEDARGLFSAVALAVPGHRVLLVGTMRPGVPEDWVANATRLDQTTRFELDRLGPKDLAALLKDSFRSQQLAEQLSFQIATKSDGNPFFVFEIIRGLREGQFITQRDDGTWASTRVIDEIQIPSSVLDLVNARVADLTQEERDLLDVACCWGFEFDPLLVGDVLGLARIPLLKRLGQIERQHRLVRASGRRYVFDHHQVQEALYGSLSELLREEYHAALAEALETRSNAAEKNAEELDGALRVDLCEHYLKGARGESALRYLEAAQTHLEGSYLNDRLIALSEDALAVPGLLRDVDRAKVLLRLMRALDLLGRRARQEECAREADELAAAAEDDALRGRAAIALGTVHLRASRFRKAEAAYLRSMELARARGDREAEAAATGNLGSVCLSQGRLPEAQKYLERSLALSREIGDRKGEARATGNLGGVFYSQGLLPEAQERFERSLALCREVGDRQGEAIAIVRLGFVFRAQARLREAQEHLETAITMCREIGDRLGEAAATGNLGGVLRAQGLLPEAQELYQRSLELGREIGYRVAEAVGTGNLGSALMDQGRLPEALARIEHQLALSREIGYREGEALALHNMGLVRREEGLRELSEQHLVRCLALSEEIRDSHMGAATRLALGSVRAAAGDVEGGRESLAAARDLARELGYDGLEVRACCELALLPGGDAEDALAAYAENREALTAEARRAARLLLWKATRDRAHLAEAKRLLDDLLAKNPPEHHESMCQNVRVNREILAAWREEFGEDSDDEEPDGTESATRVG